MPEQVENPTKPLRTWRPMILWTAAILLALGLVWFIAAVVVPVWRTHRVVKDRENLRTYFADDSLALRRLDDYLRLPAKLVSKEDRRYAAKGMWGRGPKALPYLKRLLSDRDPAVRQAGIIGVREVHHLHCEGEHPERIDGLVDTLDTIWRMAKTDPDEWVRARILMELPPPDVTEPEESK